MWSIMLAELYWLLTKKRRMIVKKTILSTIVGSALLISSAASAGNYATFGADMAGAAGFFPNNGAFYYDFSNPYLPSVGGSSGGGSGNQNGTQNQNFKPTANKGSNSSPLQQKNTAGSLLVVNNTGNGTVNVQANLSYQGNLTYNNNP